LERQQEAVEKAFLKEFNKKKSDMLQEWLIMSSAELDAECQKFGVPSPANFKDKFHALFNYLKQFEVRI